jgi:hypothetical protein
MLKVGTSHQIVLLFFREGLSIRKIAKKLKINARTVASRIKEYEDFKASPLSDQDKQFSFLGSKTFNKKKRNFFSYAYFAARVMNEPNINKQLSNAWKILHMEIKRYEWRYNLPSAQIPIEECDWQNCFQNNSEEEKF